MAINQKYKGILTVIGGSLLHFIFGSIFLWGILNEYIVSYYRAQGDRNLTSDLTGILFPVQMLSVATGIPVGIQGVKYIGSARIICLTFSILASLMVFISSYFSQFWIFLLFYGIFFGFFTGCAYFVPIYMCFLNYPNSKGFISGILALMYGLSQSIFGYIFFTIVNSQDLSSVQYYPEKLYYFQGESISVADNVPKALKILSYIYLAISIIGSLLIMHHEEQVGYAEKNLRMQLEINAKQRENLMRVMREIAQTPAQKGVSQQLFNGMIKSTISIVDKSIELYKQKEELAQKRIIINNTLKKATTPYNIFTINRNHSLSSQKLQENNHRARFPALSINIEERKNKEIDEEMVEIEKRIENLQLKSIKRISEAFDKNQHINEYLNEQHIMINNLKNTIHSKYFPNFNEKELFISQQMDLILQQELYIQKLAQQGAPSVFLAVQQKQFLISVLLSVLTIGYGLYVNANIKHLAKLFEIFSDDYSIMTSLISSLISACFRLIFSILQDKVQFKSIVSFLLVVQIISTITFKYSKVTIVFIFNQIFSHVILGGLLTIWPLFSIQLNGVIVGSQIFGIYWYGFSIANFIQFLLVLYLKDVIGFENIFYIYTGVALLALIIVQKYILSHNWANYYRNKQKEENNKKQMDSLQQQQQLVTNIHTDQPIQEICKNIQLKEQQINQLYDKVLQFSASEQKHQH